MSSVVREPSVAELRLRPLRPGDEITARAAHDELAGEGFEFLLDWRGDRRWSEYIQRLEQFRRGLEIPVARVPASFLVAQVGADLVGRVSMRHRLNAALNEVGGHIGFAV